MRVALVGGVTLAALGMMAAAPASSTVTLVLKNHRFTPSTFTVPAGRKVTIRLINQDPAGEEFDSRDLDVEEDVTPNGSTSFEVGPLKPGRYSFMGEYHAQTAEGEVVAVATGAPSASSAGPRNGR
jgi:plastocyanin